MSDIVKKLNEQGVSEIKYYYKKCPIVGNIFTACLLLTEGGQILARGISICSLSDCHNKQKARKISFERAIKAIFKKKNNDMINEISIKKNNNINNINNFFTPVVKKSFKIKDKETNLKLLEELDLLPDLEFKERNFNKNKIIEVFIPYTYPVDEAGKYFEYKSEFQPKETEQETRILKNRRI